MKGFIEIQEGNYSSMVNVNHIIRFGNKWILYVGKEYEISVNETYEEIKQLIINAQ